MLAFSFRTSLIRISTLRCFSTVTASLVKQLRELTGAPMMDCKKALQEEGVNGDMEKAVEVLRKQGMKRVNKVSSRTTQQGVISSMVEKSRGVMVELSCETDFVARNEIFQKLAGEVTEVVFRSGITNVNDILSQSLINGVTVGERLKEVIAKMGENILVNRAVAMNALKPESLLVSYQHNSVGQNMSQIASIVSFTVLGDSTKVDSDILHKIAMHVAAANPIYLNRSSVPSDVLEREKNLILETVKNVNKPAKVLNKMVEGKMSDFYKQSVLCDQLFILDEKQGSIQQLLQKLLQTSGCTVIIDSFARMQVGLK